MTDSQGKTWVGSNVGLYEIIDNVLKFNQAEIQIDSPIFFIVEDSKNQLWMGTNDGVIKWDWKKVKKYSVAQGLAGRETNRAAGFFDSRGRLWFGTDQGLSYYREEFDQKDIQPMVSLLMLEISGEQFSLQENNTFKYNQNDLTFHFQTISFINEDANRFKSKLEGYDKTWSSENAASVGNVRYTNLSPGRYRFILKAKNAENVWSESVSSAEIYIQKPFWNQWYFYLFLLLLTGLTLYSIVEFISQKRIASILKKEVDAKTAVLQEEISERKQAEVLILKQQKKQRDLVVTLKNQQETLKLLSREVLRVQEDERARISREIHDEIGQALTAVTFNLELLNNPKIQAEELEKRVKDCKQLVETAIEDVRRFAFELRPTILDDLGLLPAFKSHARRYKERTGIEIQINCPGSIDEIGDELKTVLYRIFQESLNNIAKHAQASHVKIDITRHRSKLNFKIKDNGVGFNPDNILYGDRISGGLGIKGIQERVELIGGELDLVSKPNMGTELYVSIPYG